MAGGADDNDEIVGINVTPLVDVMLVLLVIFMVTANYIAQQAITVELPKASTGEDAGTRNLAFTLDKQSQLYFRGACSDSDKLFLDLYRVHNSIFGGLLNFETTINQAYNFGNLMKSRNALLASGPRQLMDEYRVVLERHKLECSIIGDRIPTYWDGENHVLENGSAKVLFIDNGYMIADAFEFTVD